MTKKIDLVGQIFGNLKVVEFSHIHKSPCGHSISYWKCECKCGNIRVAGIGDLRRKDRYGTMSCGCLGKEMRRQLAIKRTKSNNKNWCGEGDMSGSHICQIKSNAASKNREYNLPSGYLWDLFIKQNRICPITGIELSFDTSNKKRNGNASLDRIESSKGYVVGNVQWVHKDINFMKQEYSQDYFIRMCQKVAAYNEKR